jgi:putative ABC transport system permease protein
MDTLLSDLRYALRTLRKSPTFAIVAVVTLALGIGANTVIFSLVDTVVIRALPYADSDRVVVVWEDNTPAGFSRNTPAPANYFDWRRMNRSFTDMAATRGATASLTGDGAPEQVIGRAASPSFFTVLGVQPLVGRTFTETEDRDGAHVVVISYGLWQRRYGGDPSILGRKILMSDQPYDVIGVMPRPFAFRNRDIDYWIPISFDPKQASNRGGHYLNVVARLKPGVSIQSARNDMQSIAKTLEAQYPDDNRGVGSVVVPVRDELLGNTETQLLVLMGAAVAVLLIACANLASLLLSRAAGRRGEMAVRAALGATRGRLARQLIVEGLVLSLSGGLLGFALVPFGARAIADLTPLGVVKAGTSTAVAADPRLAAFTFALAVLTGLVFSLVPAVEAGRASVAAALQQQARSAMGFRRGLTRDVLVVLQIAAAVVLLVSTGLMIRTILNFRAIDIGFNAHGLLTMRTSLPRPKYADPNSRTAFYDRVVAGVSALPGVERAAFGFTLPFTSGGNTTGFSVEHRPIPPGAINDTMLRAGTTRYLETLGARVVDGRLIDHRDGASTPRAVVINETLAHQFFPDTSPLGHRMQLGDERTPFYTIVGVVKDLRERGYQNSLKPAVYLSIAQAPETWAVPDYLVIRARTDPSSLAEAARRVIASVDPAQPVSAVRLMDDILDIEIADRRQQMTLLGAFASLALVLASLGLYGVLSYAVAQRRREIGLRVALGASAGAVVTMFALRGLRLTTMGLAIGAATAWASTRAMSGALYGVRATDPSTFAGVLALLGTTAVIASIVPAVRASRVDPMVVLRDE